MEQAVESEWKPKVNSPVGIAECDILGIFEGVMVDAESDDCMSCGHKKESHIDGLWRCVEPGVNAVSYEICQCVVFRPNILPGNNGLVRFVANDYERYKNRLSHYNCFNPNSKLSRLCIIPLVLIIEPHKEKSSNGSDKPGRQTAQTTRQKTQSN